MHYEEILEWALEPEIFHELVKFLQREVNVKETPEFAEEKVAAKFRQRQAQYGRLLQKAVEQKKQKFEKLVSDPAMAQKLLKALMPVCS